MKNKLEHFKSPGVYIQENDINISYAENFKVFCKKCLNQVANTFEPKMYCVYCKEETIVISKGEMREIKIDKLI